MDQHLRVPILPAIELCVGSRRLVDTDLVRDDEGWFGAPGNDHVAKVAVVHLDVALACADRETLDEVSLVWITLLPFKRGVRLGKE